MATDKVPQKKGKASSAPAAKAASQSNTTLTGSPVDKIIIDPDMIPANKGVTEAASVQTRVKRSITMKRYKSKIQRAKQVARKRLAGKKQLSRRSLKQAKDVLRKRYAGNRGARYATLSRQDKVAVDKLLDKRKALIKKVAGRIYNRVKQNELRRFSGVMSGKKAKKLPVPIVASLDMSFKDHVALIEKSMKHDVDSSVLIEVFQRGLNDWSASSDVTKQQHAFARVNSFLARGKAFEMDKDLGE